MHKRRVRVSDHQVPPRIAKQLWIWSWQAKLLRFTQVFLGLLATIASMLVAAKMYPFEHIEWFAFIAAASVALLSSLDLSSKANRMRDAWRLLNTAVMRYENSLLDVEGLFRAYEEGEKIIGDVNIKVGK
jgi:hypothetical protein